MACDQDLEGPGTGIGSSFSDGYSSTSIIGTDINICAPSSYKLDDPDDDDPEGDDPGCDKGSSEEFSSSASDPVKSSTCGSMSIRS
jgi:hypothetical protein